MNEATTFAVSLGTSLIVGSVLYVLGIRFGRDIERAKVRRVVIDTDGSVLADSGVEVERRDDTGASPSIKDEAYAALEARGFKRINDR